MKVISPRFEDMNHEEKTAENIRTSLQNVYEMAQELTQVYFLFALSSHIFFSFLFSLFISSPPQQKSTMIVHEEDFAYYYEVFFSNSQVRK